MRGDYPVTGDRDGHSRIKTVSYADPTTGYRAYGDTYCLKYHRASLPRLLHGDNGKLIKSQAELDAAMDLLLAKAGELGIPQIHGYQYTRVDLVLQFIGDPAAFVSAHLHARHPRIYSDPVRYETRSLALKGSELRITIYDKIYKTFKRNGNIVRVEIQLKGRVLMEMLGQGQKVTSLNFDDCYQTYRRIMVGFVSNAIPKVGGGINLLAAAQRDGYRPNGISAFDFYTTGKCERQIRRIKKELASYRSVVHEIDWSQLLPADGPPPPVELGPQELK